jgi:hypothetical protein
VQSVRTVIGAMDEPPQRIDSGGPGVLEPNAHIRQVQLAPGFAGKTYVGYKAPGDAKAIVSCTVFASLEPQIRIWVRENNVAARVFQMKHEKPTDEIMIVSQANASFALRQQKQARIFDSAGCENEYAGSNRKATIGKDADIDLSHFSAILACVET